MFESLDEQIRKDEDKSSTPQQRIVRYVLYAVAGVAAFGALIFGVYRFS